MVVTATPNVAASSSLRLSGVLICKSPLTAMYFAKLPSVSLKPFLEIQPLATSHT